MEVSEIGTGQPVIEKNFKPTAKQAAVIQMPDSRFEGLGGGAAGGGKTDLGLMIPCIRQFTEHPKFKGLVMRRTYPDLEKEIVPRQHEWYKPMGAKYNEVKKRWKFPSGAMIQNGHAEREQDVRKYDSAEYNYIDWDESTHFTGFQYLYLSLSRCRSSSPDLPAFVRAFTNPGNIGHSFFKSRFVDPCPRGMQVLRDKITGQKRMYIPFLGRDNPYLSINDPNYLIRLEGMPEIERKAKLHGDWNSYEGQVFSEFRTLRLSDEPPNAVHVFKPFPIPEWWPKIWAIDWGYKAMTYAIWGAISPDGRLYVYRTASWVKTLIKIWAQELVNLSRDEVFEDMVICHSAGAHKGEEMTVKEQVNEAFNDRYAIREADRDRIGGKNAIHEYLRWSQLPKGYAIEKHYNPDLAGKILRVHGEEKWNDYMMAFVDKPDEDNLPKLQIFEKSMEGMDAKLLIDAIPQCIPSETNPEDVEEFDGDDPYDALRMLVKTSNRYFDESADRALINKRKQEIANALADTKNQTAFYMQLEKLEDDDGEYTTVRRKGYNRQSRFHQ